MGWERNDKPNHPKPTTDSAGNQMTENASLRAEVKWLKGILLRGLRELENSHGWDCTHGCNSDCPNYEKCSLQTTLEILRKAVRE